MAFEAKITPGSSQLKFVRRLMRVMAFGTFPFFNWHMNDLLRCQLFMTLGAELANIGYGRELMFALFFVAYIAVTSSHRSMDEFILSHVCMA
jgi:hypothetical protein